MSEYKELRSRVEYLEGLCACAYQLAGLVGAPLRFLDALSLNHGQADIDSLLPVTLEECDEFDALRAQLAAAKATINELSWDGALNECEAKLAAAEQRLARISDRVHSADDDSAVCDDIAIIVDGPDAAIDASPGEAEGGAT